MNQYILDTDICVFTLRGRYELDKKIIEVGIQNCFLSEITVAELKVGAEKSEFPLKNHQIVELFCNKITILPISRAIDIFAEEKAKLQKSGRNISDFDLLIGATAIYYQLVLATNNVKHFSRMEKLLFDNWIQKQL
ncbi:MAG: PIN domain-containing protein [Planctomycetaceae bacterium]|jgi:tRNA(fMet)-specific endonuclease VapC|nr:PIN domain-containing protein [Planctomycetaceae bacterium]